MRWSLALGDEILEYCAEGVNPVEREQYFLDLLKPEYNILNKAGSLLGFKHKAETLEFFKNERKVSVSTRENLSKAATVLWGGITVRCVLSLVV